MSARDEQRGGMGFDVSCSEQLNSLLADSCSESEVGAPRFATAMLNKDCWLRRRSIEASAAALRTFCVPFGLVISRALAMMLVTGAASYISNRRSFRVFLESVWGLRKPSRSNIELNMKRKYDAALCFVTDVL